MNLYQAYGLTFSSQMKLPELQISDSSTTDVTIRYGKIDYAFKDIPENKNRIWHTQENLFLLNAKHIGSFLVKDGNSIIIDAKPEIKEEDIRFVLLGSVLAALLQQKKLLTLHAGAIETERGAILFIAPSGYGKSTLTAAFAKQEFAIISDDVVAIDTAGEQLTINPTFPKLRLWKDSVAKIGISPETIPKARAGVEKYLAPIAKFSQSPAQLYKIYLLDFHKKDDIKLEILTGAQKLEVLLNNTYRIKFLSGLNLSLHHNIQIMKIAQQIEIVKITRPIQTFSLDEVVTRVRNDAQI